LPTRLTGTAIHRRLERRGHGHLTQLQILLRLHDGERSPERMADELALPLGRVSHHVRTLRDAQLINETRTRQRAGAVEHFYVLSDEGVELLDRLNLT
jgi:DNA-binding MarR family transcriptional regulator